MAVSLTKLFGKDGHDIEQKIVNAPSASERVKHAETFLLNLLTDAETIDRVVKSTVEMLLTANGQLQVKELSTAVNINRRQLERKFTSAIGLSPKQLAKTIRLQSALKMMSSLFYGTE